MDAPATLLILLLTGLALLLLALTGLVLIDRFARSKSGGQRGDRNTQATPAERAEALLLEVLDERECRQLAQRGYVDVASPTDAQRIYRIPGYIGLVCVYERGIAVRQLCVQSVEPLPSADIVAMHKLLIQGDEQGYLARARHYACIEPNLRYRP